MAFIIGTSSSNTQILAAGTTAERPASPSAGQLRYSITNSGFEAYNGTGWSVIASTVPSTIDYLLVGGGGGAGANNYHSGGGGAGGVLIGNTAIISGTIYTITVGSPGVGPSSAGTKGGDGGFSAISGSPIVELPSGNAGTNTIKAYGGGGGGVYPGVNLTGRDGGSGGGAGAESSVTGTAGRGIYPGSTYINSTRQGYNGGNFPGTSGSKYGGGGGGGGGAGQDGGSSGGNGGVGIANPFQASGSTYGHLVSGTYYFAGGGGGSTENGATTSGGNGGGGSGSSANGTSGISNTGGGGGAGERLGSITGSGGSGIVIIRYTDNFAIANTVTGSPNYLRSGGYHIYTWTGNGSIRW